MRRTIAFALALLCIGAGPSPTVSQILERMRAQRQGLTSFEVPVHFDVNFHKLITLHRMVDGSRYFKRPDHEALIMHATPIEARAFQRIYEGLGTPETWPKKYVISISPPTTVDGVDVYELTGVPRKNGNVDHVTLDVRQDNVVPVRARWFYKNGGTAEMQIVETKVAGKYYLPSTEAVQINFPSYEAHGNVTYGTYKINAPIPDSVFKAH